MPAKSFLCIVIIVGFLGVAPNHALADWQYTKWGMTEAEVIKASQGAAGPVAASDLKGGRIGTVNRLSAPYSAGPYQFRAIFAFDPATNGLAVVTLKVVNKADGYGVKADLGAKYGQPIRTTTGIYATVEWQTDKDVVTFVDVASGAFSVEYRPRETGASRGL